LFLLIAEKIHFIAKHDTISQIQISKAVAYQSKTNTLKLLMYQIGISTTQVSSVMLRSKKLEIRKKNVKTEKAVGRKPNRLP
jgi:hypothetical protein